MGTAFISWSILYCNENIPVLFVEGPLVMFISGLADNNQDHCTTLFAFFVYLKKMHHHHFSKQSDPHAHRDKVPERQRQDSSTACDVIVLSDAGTLFEEAGCGAAGPVISHSWLTVMTHFSCPKASVFKSFGSRPATHSHNWLPKNKVVWTGSLGEVYSGEKSVIVESTGVHSSEAAGGCCQTTAAHYTQTTAAHYTHCKSLAVRM